jgi:hypothetical protein
LINKLSLKTNNLILFCRELAQEAQFWTFMLMPK